MIDLGTALRHYKRKEILDEMLASAKNREVAAKFGDKGFGKRPDTLNYSADILELVRQGATSFHVSEEIWKNPLQLSTEMKKSDADSLRAGWNLIIDIDFEVWEITKLICFELIKALKEHGIESASCKFSGNKGFHIGIPFEAFPEKVHGKDTRLLFPEATKRIVIYLSEYIDNIENSFKLSKIIANNKDFRELAKNSKKSSLLIKEVCLSCGSEIVKQDSQATEFVCPSCSRSLKSYENERYMVCSGCGKYMERIGSIPAQKGCPKCRSRKTAEKVNLFIDEILISSRHLYRMPYSLHEKSGLASIPINSSFVLDFDRNNASPEKIKFPLMRFLDTEKIRKGEASKLIIQAFDYKMPENEEQKQQKEYEPLDFSLQEQFFPPCILRGLKGIQDGRKRFCFILINFLSSVGWDNDAIKKELLEWNKKNPEPLRESLILSQLSYYSKRKKRILPPNCSNSSYYKDMGICVPEELCRKIRNPVNYSIIKSGSRSKK